MAERDLELLDDYLANRLDPKDRSAFEEKLNTDPALKSEFILQQQFIAGIKQARVAELKTMMNNVPVPPVHGASAVAGKVALWTLIFGLIGSGLYLYLNDTQEPVKETSATTVKEGPAEEPAQQPEKDTSQQQPEERTHDDGAVVAEEPASLEQKPSQSPKPPKRKARQQAVKEPAIEVFDPTKENATEPATPGVEGNIGNVNPNPSIEVSVDADNKKFKFHYQFKDGKLLLYGPFQEGLYEIMEFFSDDQKRTIFLYYKDSFYLLQDDRGKLRTLNAIEDPALIKKLREYRN
jgi:hypothetical protein